MKQNNRNRFERTAKGWGHNQDIIYCQIKSNDLNKDENLALKTFTESTHIKKILLWDTLQVEVWADMTNLGKGRKDEDSFCWLWKGKIN